MVSQGISERQHINALRNYFDEDGTPLTKSFNIGGKELIVPLYILADHSSIGLEELDIIDFDDFIQEKLDIVEMNPSFLSRSVNEGFSGGEKKRNEILQMAILDPSLAILDETDSGLDIDALRIVAGGVNKLSTPLNSSLVITHYQRLLNYIIPDFIHVMENGKIILTGDKNLALELEEKGYDWLKEEEAVLA